MSQDPTGVIRNLNEFLENILSRTWDKVIHVWKTQRDFNQQIIYSEIFKKLNSYLSVSASLSWYISIHIFLFPLYPPTLFSNSLEMILSSNLVWRSSPGTVYLYADSGDWQCWTRPANSGKCSSDPKFPSWIFLK
jgi:hypothetical protein